MSPERFQEAWLRLREPVDHRSRAEAIVGQLSASWSGRQEVRLVDLGCGAGSNLRYLSSRLGIDQTWVLVDHDADLLRRLERPESVGTLERVHADLDDYLHDLARDPLPVDGVTASALLDLVSDTWLQRFVEVCVGRRCPVLAALTYDGGIDWIEPAGAGRAGEGRRASGPDDERVRDAMNAHQRGDKGLGPALGPEAGPRAAELFGQEGYRVVVVPSPWRLTSSDALLAAELIAGWAGAAIEREPGSRSRLEAWATGRTSDVTEGRVELVVGHVDLLAVPG